MNPKNVVLYSTNHSKKLLEIRVILVEGEKAQMLRSISQVDWFNRHALNLINHYILPEQAGYSIASLTNKICTVMCNQKKKKIVKL